MTDEWGLADLPGPDGPFWQFSDQDFPAVGLGDAAFDEEWLEGIFGPQEAAVSEGSAGHGHNEVALSGPSQVPRPRQHEGRHYRGAQEWAESIVEYHTLVGGALPNSRKAALAVGHEATYNHLVNLRNGNGKISPEEAGVLSALSGDWASDVFPEGAEGRPQYLRALAGLPEVPRPRQSHHHRGAREWADRIVDYHTRVSGALPDSRKAARAVGHEATYDRLVHLRNGRTKISPEEAGVLSALSGGWVSVVFPEGAKGRPQYLRALEGLPEVPRPRQSHHHRGAREWADRIVDYHTRVSGAPPNSQRAALAVGHEATYARLAHLRNGVCKISPEEAGALSALSGGWASVVFPEGVKGRPHYLAMLSEAPSGGFTAGVGAESSSAYGDPREVSLLAALTSPGTSPQLWGRSAQSPSIAFPTTPSRAFSPPR
ncbi:hypothetical protein [Micromonospora yangpuensis]|uniref:Uncharacterized protein n=1 Tax=Micromonospora yangpuensis TaxID=683228 RepID=A0A1C6V8S5_9ACTN|nr:hypothetical protein [Micromonospora yangpuensis]GGM32390.1 hypothetical protein GCM10012279_59170 [Micromonospora yangpuensis]SCL62665.1 hypothetical protein GA0070617_4989 [Micromonospora yangpuensis]